MNIHFPGVVQIDDDEDVARVSPEKDELLEAEAGCLGMGEMGYADHGGSCSECGLDRMSTAGLGSWMVAVWPLGEMAEFRMNTILWRQFKRLLEKHHENLSFGANNIILQFLI